MALCACACSHSPRKLGQQSPGSVARLAGVQLCKPNQCNLAEPVPPDEPYRYLSPPPGGAVARKLRSARVVIVLDDAGRNSATYLNSEEAGPQISVYFSTGCLTGAPRARVTISATAVASPGRETADGHVVGNAYRVSAVADLGVAPSVTTPVEVQLRVPPPISANGRYLVEVQNGPEWTAVPTVVAGTDVVQANLPRLGAVVAVVQLGNR